MPLRQFLRAFVLLLGLAFVAFVDFDFVADLDFVAVDFDFAAAVFGFAFALLAAGFAFALLLDAAGFALAFDFVLPESAALATDLPAAFTASPADLAAALRAPPACLVAVLASAPLFLAVFFCRVAAAFLADAERSAFFCWAMPTLPLKRLSRSVISIRLATALPPHLASTPAAWA